MYWIAGLSGLMLYVALKACDIYGQWEIKYEFVALVKACEHGEEWRMLNGYLAPKHLKVVSNEEGKQCSCLVTQVCNNREQ